MHPSLSLSDRLHRLLRQRNLTTESGFTLTEVVVVCSILLVLAGIGIPMFLGVQAHTNSQVTSTGLSQASVIVEQQKTDLNGLYPRYLPNEIMQNSLWSKYSYTYSDDRLTYCLQGNDSSNAKWFISSSSRSPSHTPCTQTNLGTNSVPPFGVPSFSSPNGTGTIDNPQVTYTWTGNNPEQRPTANVSWDSGVCTTSDGNSTQSGSGVVVTYLVKVYDPDTTSANNTAYSAWTSSLQHTTATTSLPSSWQSGTSATIDLSGFIAKNPGTGVYSGMLPGDKLQISVEMGCTVTSYNVSYPYWKAFGSPTVKALSYPKMPTASYTSAPSMTMDYNASSTQANKYILNAKATFAQISCPIGTAAYQLTASQTGKSDLSSALVTGPLQASDSTLLQKIQLTNSADSNWLSSSDAAKKTYSPDAPITFTGYAYCMVYNSTSTYVQPPMQSNKLSTDTYTPVAPPVSVNNLATTSAYASTGTTPNGLTWDATTCQYGGTAQYSYVQEYPASSASGFTTTVGAGPITWAQGAQYKYHIEAECVATHSTSAITKSATLSFATDVNMSVNPSYSSNPAYYYTPTGSGSSKTAVMKVGAVFNAYSCPTGTTAQYQLIVSQTNGSTITQASGPGTNPGITVTLPSNFQANSQLTYTGYAYCYVPQPDGSQKPYTSNPIVTYQTPAPATPDATYLNGDINTADDSDVVMNRLTSSLTYCYYGGTAQYSFGYKRSSDNSYTYSSWSNNNAMTNDASFNDGRRIDGLDVNVTYNFIVNVRCAGSPSSSDTVTSPVMTQGTVYNTPHTPGNPNYLAINTTDPNYGQTTYWGNSTGCDRGGQLQYYLRERTYQGSYSDGGFNNTGWTTATNAYTQGWIGNQGAPYDYGVVSRCVNSTGSSYNSQWKWLADTSGLQSYNGAPVGFYEGIQTPGNVNLYNNGATYVYWNSANCPSGTYAQYSPNENYHSGQNVNWWYGWQTGTSVYTSQYPNGYEKFAVDIRCVSQYTAAGTTITSGENYNTNYYTDWNFSQPQITTGGINGFGDASTGYDSQIYANASPSIYGWSIQNAGQLQIAGNGDNAAHIYGAVQTDGNIAPYVCAQNNWGQGCRQFGSGYVWEYIQWWHGYQDFNNWQNLNYAPLAQNGYYHNGINNDNTATKYVTSASNGYGQNCNNGNTNTPYYGACGLVYMNMYGLRPGVTYYVSASYMATTAPPSTAGSNGCGTAAKTGALHAYISCFVIGIPNGGGYDFDQNVSAKNWQTMHYQFTANSTFGQLMFGADNQSTTSEHEWELDDVIVSSNGGYFY